MPKFDYAHKAGDQLPPAMKDFLRNYFEHKDLEKLEVLGGTVVLQISTKQRGIKKDKNKIVDENYIEYLHSLHGDKTKMHDELLTLTRPQLNKICKEFNLPFSSQITNREIIRNVERRIVSTDRWSTIIGC